MVDIARIIYNEEFGEKGILGQPPRHADPLAGQGDK